MKKGDTFGVEKRTRNKEAWHGYGIKMQLKSASKSKKVSCVELFSGRNESRVTPDTHPWYLSGEPSKVNFGRR